MWWILVTKIRWQFYKMYVSLGCLVIRKHVTDKWHKASNDQILDASQTRLRILRRNSPANRFWVLPQAVWIQLTVTENDEELQLERYQFFVRHRLSFYRTFVPQLQLWHIHWLVFVKSVGDYIHKWSRQYTSYLREKPLQPSKHISVWMTSTRMKCEFLYINTVD
jgi:hypothetical protein